MTSPQLERDAAKALRHQPKAHAPWQTFYRRVQFKGAVERFTTHVYELTGEQMSDQLLVDVEDLVAAMLKIVQLHVSRIGSEYRTDAGDKAYFVDVMERLQAALDGLTQGLSPDPAKRPTSDELLDQFADMLQRPA
jgi:hypothetical protein